MRKCVESTGRYTIHKVHFCQLNVELGDILSEDHWFTKSHCLSHVSPSPCRLLDGIPGGMGPDCHRGSCAFLGGIPMGVIAVETRGVDRFVPADPSNPESSEVKETMGGKVWFPDSAVVWLEKMVLIWYWYGMIREDYGLGGWTHTWLYAHYVNHVCKVCAIYRIVCVWLCGFARLCKHTYIWIYLAFGMIPREGLEGSKTCFCFCWKFTWLCLCGVGLSLSKASTFK